MVPKLDWSRRYAAKALLFLHSLLAMKQLVKAVTGPLMRQEEGQEFRQITELEMIERVNS